MHTPPNLDDIFVKPLDPIYQLLDALPADHPTYHTRISEQHANLPGILTTTRVYGFNTHFGHHDHHDQTDPIADQRTLLNLHCVYPTSEVTDAFIRLLAAIKTIQLANTPSGIHPDTYRQLYQAATRNPDPHRTYIGNWTISYSCGDVSPAAWMVHSLTTTSELTLTYPGDVICLINGTFYSTTVAWIALQYAALVLERAISDISSFYTHAASTNRGTQLSVTARDQTPLLNAVAHTITAVADRIYQRITTPSANPILIADRTQFASNASFLDFTLANQLLTLIATIQQTNVYLAGTQRVITNTYPEGITKPLQPDKLATAATLANPTVIPTWAINESNGIEDVADRTLDLARTVIAQATQTETLRSHIASEIRTRYPEWGALRPPIDEVNPRLANLLTGLT